jgi:hypothetical protein
VILCLMGNFVSYRMMGSMRDMEGSDLGS